MKRTPILLVLFMISCLASAAHAQTATGVINATFTVDTKYVDGSPMPASEVIQQRVAWGTCGTGNALVTKLGEHKLAGSARSDSITGLAVPGTYCVGVFTTAQKAGADPVESDPIYGSLTFTKPVTPKPGPPGTITMTCTLVINGQNQPLNCTATATP